MLMIDLSLIALATVGALLLRDNLVLSAPRLQALAPYLGTTLLVAVPISILFGLNRSIWRLSAMADYLKVVLATLVIVFAATGLSFIVNRLDGVARALPVLQAILMVCLLVGARVVIRQRHALRRRAPAFLAPIMEDANRHETILIVGLNRVAELYLQALQEFAAEGTIVAGVLGQNDRHTGRLVQQQKILGTPETH